MKKYESLDISGDAGLRIRGENLEELFENAAAGMSGLITNTSGIKETEKKEFVLSFDNHESLLVRWLNEIIFLFDAHGFIGRLFSVSFKGNTLEARISGGIFDPEVNEGRLLIKAATYHRLSLKKINSHWEATVIFDI